MKYPAGDLRTFLKSLDQGMVYENMSSLKAHGSNTPQIMEDLIKLAAGVASGLSTLHNCKVHKIFPLLHKPLCPNDVVNYVMTEIFA